jgi:hypothetical protein
MLSAIFKFLNFNFSKFLHKNPKFHENFKMPQKSHPRAKLPHVNTSRWLKIQQKQHQQQQQHKKIEEATGKSEKFNRNRSLLFLMGRARHLWHENIITSRRLCSITALAFRDITRKKT